MTIELNHTIVPARDKEESVRFYERMFGFKYEGPMGHFAPIKIPSQSLTLDFDNRESFQTHHYAFKVSEDEFDEIFGRIVEVGLAYGSEPWKPENGEINHCGPSSCRTYPYICLSILWAQGAEHASRRGPST